MANERRLKLWQGLNKHLDIGSYDDFDKAMNDDERRKKFYDNVSEYYDIGSFNDFEQAIAPSKYKLNIKGEDVNVSEREYKDFLKRNKPAAAASRVETPAGWGEIDAKDAATPAFMKNEATQKKSDAVKKTQAAVRSAVTKNIGKKMQQGKDRSDYFAATGKPLEHTHKGVEWEKIGYAPTVERDETGEIERNENGEPVVGMVNDKTRANFQIEEKDRIRKENIANQIEELRKRQEELRNQMAKKRASDAVYTQDALSPYADPRTTDAELASLDAAYRQTEENIKGLQVELAGGQQGFVNGFLTTAKDPSTWLLGFDKMGDTMNMLRVSKKLQSGQELTDSEKKMLEATYGNSQQQAKLAEDSDWLYRAGAMTANMLPFAAQIATTDGFNGVAAIGTRMGENWAKKYIAQFGEKAFMNRVAANVLKGTGVVLGDVAAGFTNAVTTNIGNTANDILERNTGNLTINEKGQYEFEGAEDLLRSVGKGLVSQTKEFATERGGMHLPSLREMNVWFAKRGVTARNISRALSGLAGTKAMQKTANFLRKGGINGIGGEIFEEEIGLPVDVAIGDMTWDDAFSKKTQWDIVGGMCMSVGAMHAAGLTVQGAKTAKDKVYNTYQYYKYKRRADKTSLAASNAIGKDAWSAMQAEIDGTKTEDMSSYWDKVVDNNSLSLEQKRAVFNYINALTVERGYNLGMMFAASERAKNPALAATVTPTTSAEQTEIDMMENTDRGYNLSEPAEMADARSMFDYQMQRAIDTFGEIRGLDEYPVQTIQTMEQGGYTPEQIQIAKDYVNAKAAYDGMQQKVEDDIDTQVTQAQNYVDSHTNKEDNQVHPVTLKDGREVYITGRNVVLNEDGTVDVAATKEQLNDGMLFVTDNNGVVSSIDVDDIAEAGAPVDADEQKEEVAAAIRQQVEDEAQRKQQGILPFNEGDTYNVLDGEGQQHTVTILSAVDGEGNPIPLQQGQVLASVDGAEAQPMAAADIQAMADNTQQVRVAEAVAEEQAQQEQQAQEEAAADTYKFHNLLTINTENGPVRAHVTTEENEDGLIEVYSFVPINGKKLNLFTREELDNMVTEVMPATEEQQEEETFPAGEQMIPSVGTNDSQGGNTAEAEEYLNEQFENAPEQTEELEPMPMNGEDADFSQVTPTRAHAYIYNEADLSREDADQFVAANKKVADDALKKVKKDKKPVMGTSISKFKKEMQAWQENVDAAQQAADYWQEVQDIHKQADMQESMNTPSGRMELLEKASTKERKIALAKEMYSDLFDDDFTVANDIMELVALNMPKNISWEDINGKRGLQYELGLRRGVGKGFDSNAFNSYLAKKGEGISFAEAVHSIFESEDNQLQNGEHRFDDQEIRNALIDMFLSADKPTSIRDYVFNSRVARAEDALRAEQAREEEYREMERLQQMANRMYNMTYEEAIDWVANIEELANIRDEYENSQEYLDNLENNSNFAQNNTESNDTGTEGQTGSLQTEGAGEGEVSRPSSEESIGTLPGQASEQTGVPQNTAGGNDEATAGVAGQQVTNNIGATSSADVIAEEEAKVNTNPSEGQKKAGNYAMGHIKVDGFDVTIENPKGSVRSGVDASGKAWSQTMNNTYGYIRGTEGVDGDHIDVFLSDTPEQGNVFVIDQLDQFNTFDEHKVMYGFPDMESAKQAYLSNYEEGWQGLGDITEVSKEEFKKWVNSSHRKTKPFAEYKSVKPVGDVQLGESATNNHREYIKAFLPQVGEEFASLADNLSDAEVEELYNLIDAWELVNDEYGKVMEEQKEALKSLNKDTRKAAKNLIKEAQERADAAYEPVADFIKEHAEETDTNTAADNKFVGEFVTNDMGVCLNPNIIGEHKDKKYTYIGYDIKTAETEKGWVGGVDVETPTSGFASPVTALEHDKYFETEQECQAYWAQKAFEHLEKAAQENKKMSKYLPSLKNIIDKANKPAEQTDNYLQPRDAEEEKIVANVNKQLQKEIDAAIKQRDKAAADLRKARAKESDRATDLFGNDDTFNQPGQLFGNSEMPVDPSAEGVDRRTKAEQEALNEAQANLVKLQSVQERNSRIRGALDNHRKQTTFDTSDTIDTEWIKSFVGGVIDDEDITFVDKMTSEEVKELQAIIDRTDVGGNTDEAEAYVNRMREKYPVEKAKKEETTKDNAKKSASYSVTPKEYVTKKGKKLDMLLVKFNDELSKEQQRAAATLARSLKGWWSKEDGGFMMRDEDSVKQLVESLNNEETVADAQPLSVSDMAAATEQTPTVRVIDVADVMQALKEKGETKLSDHGTLISGGVPKTETETKKTGYGANNTLVSKDRYEELKERMRKKLGGQMNMGIDPEILAIGTEMAAFHIEAGARKFADFARNMIADLGDAIRPYLKSFYNGARELPEVEEAGYSNDMTPYDEVRTFDVANFDKATTDAMAAAEEVIKEQEVSKQAEEAVQKITEQRNDGRRAQSEGVALDGTPLRPATDADLDNRADAEYYHNGKRVYIMAVMRSGEQVNALQFSKPVTDRIYLTNGQSVKLDELMTKDDKKEPISPKEVKQVVEKAKKTRKKKGSAEKSISLQRDLFADVEQNDNDNERSNGENPSTEQEGRAGASASANENVRGQRVSEEESARPERRGNSTRGIGSEDRRGSFGVSQGEPAGRRAADNSGLDAGLQERRNDGRTDSSVSSGTEQVRSSSERPTGRIQKLERPTNPKNTNNNHAERGKDYAPKDVDARIEANIKAIELMQQLIESGEKATPKQMAVLRQFSGWGGLGKAFENNSAYTNGKPTPDYLRELLGEEAYEQANMSRNSAYYTPANIIDTLWDIARAMGFTGGKFLEGSAGIGNIIGLMPTDLSERSNIQAVEIDQTTGNILRLLYPDAQVDIKGFEATEVENGTVDLAITNVPFVPGMLVPKDTTGDADLSRKFRNSLQDFCIAKNIRKLREGGIGIFITSRSTLDSSAKLREWIVQDGNTDVVGAFRLNKETFGGTGATSDIIVVRKRINGKKSPYAIDVLEVSGERTAEYDTGEEKKVKGTYVPVIKTLSMDYNKYFVEHPEMMAGKMYFNFEKGNTFRPTSKALYPVKGMNQKTMLTEWANSFADKEWESPAAELQSTQTDNVYEELGEGVKEGSIVVRNGKLFIAQRGIAVPLDVNANKVKGHTKAECFEAYKAIKDALADLLAYQTENEGDEDLQKYLTALNKAYDSFVKTYGHLHKNTSISFLKNDVDFANILALEKFSEKPDVSGKKVQEYGKTDIFSRRVVDMEKAPEPDNVKDGIIASLYVHGRIDIPWITEQLNSHSEETAMRTEDDVRNEILKSGLGFENPDTRQIEVSYEYLSGNVREKLQQARDNNSDGRYDSNIKALEEVVPMNIPPHLIEFNLGSSWIDPKLYEEYIKERTDVDVTCTPAGGTWFVKTPYWVDEEKNKTMGVRSEMFKKVVLGTQLIEAAMQNKTITVSETHKKFDGSTETITDKEATQACANKIDEIRADFKDWAKAKMQTDPELSERIERTYNDMFNNYVPKSIPDEFVPEHFGGAATVVDGKPFTLRPHQGKAVVRGTTQPLLLAHEVGTGKTYTLISTAMEMRRLGTARKPMIVVQNATVGQFVESAKKLYPNAKVLTIEDKDHTGEGRKNFYAKIKYNDWDMIVVPQSVFERIPDSEERQMAYVKDKIEEKLLVLEQMKDADPQGNSMIVRQAEKEIANLEDELTGLSDSIVTKRKQRDEKKAAVTRQNAEIKALEMLDRQTDDVENFDDMGIDAILVDEAHEYKHLGFATAMQRGVKGIDPSYSKKAQGVFLKTQAVLEKNNGRNVIFATGTPISNTAAEIWTFMRYLMPADTMKEYGIYYFDDFVRNFGNIQQMLEFTTSGKFKENNRFAGYVNLPELVRIWAGVADTVLTREAGGVSDKIPEMEGGKAQDLYLPQTKALRSVMKFVKKTLNEYDNMTGKQKKENSHIPLTMYGIAKAAAVDARLVVANAADEEQSKTNEAVRQILKSLEETKDYKGTVAVFADNYQNKKSGFNLYEDIREKLIAAGLPAEQIVVMKSGMTVKKKLEIFDAVNRGDIRVIMGSTFTLGTGVNIQERLHTLIHLDAPNRPMDYTQRNGRILRQGNLHKEMGKPVRVLRFGVEDSLDVTAYQRLKTKGAIADSIMNGKKMIENSMENRALEEEEDVFGDTVAQLSGSEYAMLKNQAEKDVRKYEAKRKQYEADQKYCHSEIPRLKKEIEALKDRLEKNRKNLEKVENISSPVIVINKQQYANVDATADFLKDYNKKIREAENELRDNPSIQTQERKMTVNVGGIDFEFTTELTIDMIQNQGQLFTAVRRKMTYSCPTLNLSDVPVKQALLREGLEDIVDTVITGDDFRYNIDTIERLLAKDEKTLEQVTDREGKPFEFEEELKKAHERFEEYSELMKKELEEKEKKYADMDAGVEEASDITDAEEDDEESSDDEDIRGRGMEDENETPIFVSNAMRAVEGIKQEKATGDQWLAMLQKAGGLKAGEDKWLGLSDWLKDAATKGQRTLTKSEVLDYIRENEIQIEEVNYAEGMPDEAADKFKKLNDEYHSIFEQMQSERSEEFTDGEIADAAFDEMINRYGDDFGQGFQVEGTMTREGVVYDIIPQYDFNDDISPAALYYLDSDINPINNTRLDYTTEGLTNKREIALVVPTIESWNTGDSVHFGDAGEGRAVAWVRFGETEITEPNADIEKAYKKAAAEYKAYRKYLRDKYGESWKEKRTQEEHDKIYELWGNLNKANEARLNDKGVIKERVLVIDEIQSKRHQEGREKGYKKPFPEEKKAAMDEALRKSREYNISMQEKYKLDTFPDQWHEKATQEEIEEGNRLFEDYLTLLREYESFNGLSGVPDAPFDKNWHELAMKRMLRYAAENGFDKVAWTTGEQQADRYNIGKLIKEISVSRWGENINDGPMDADNPNDLRDVLLRHDSDGILLSVNREGKVVEAPFEKEFEGKQLADIIGKDLSLKVIGTEGKGNISGDALRIGGEGMKGFYDEILPRFMNKYGKKWGVKVEDISLPEIGQTMHSVDITPEMQESVMQGQLMFREVGDEALQEWLDSQPTIKMYRSMVLIDGKLYPPMSSKEAEGSQLRQPSELGKWEEAEEAPEAAVQRNGRWVFPLRKDNGKMLYAAYNPYIHTSASMLNDQFSEAQNRDNLVVVEMEVPASELMSEYRAARAKDSVGMKDWKAGVIQGQLTGTRKVMLSRRAKPVRIVPTEEVADNIASQIAGQIDVMPTNVVTPQVRKALEERGVKFVETDNRGKILSGRYAGRTWSLVYGKPRKAGSLKREGGNYEDRPYSEALAESRAAGYTKKQFDTYIRNVHRRMRDMAEYTVAKLGLGDRVIIKDNAAGLTGDRAKLKGWYNVKTGKIVVVLGNHASVEDVKQTVLHEAVAHYGLRQLFGKNFTQFLSNVFNSAAPDVQRRINALALKHNWNWDVATEEYLASLAEKTDFERASDQGWWMKIKRLFLDMLSKVGLDFRGELTDNELRYILWRSYENLAEPDRYNNPFNVAADVAMQYNLKVGKYAEPEQEERMVAEQKEENRVAEVIPISRANVKKISPYAAQYVSNLNPSELTDEQKDLIDDAYNKIKARNSNAIGMIKTPFGYVMTDEDATTMRLMLPKEIGNGYVLVSEDGLDALLPELVRRGNIVAIAELPTGGKAGEIDEIRTVSPDVLFRESDRDRAIARDAYERMVSSGMYQFQEAVQDSMLGLEKLYKAILGEDYSRIEDIPDYENAYLAENIMSSKNMAQQHMYQVRFMKPLLAEISALTGGSNAERIRLTRYMMAKHGLERNEVFAQRDFEAYKEKYPDGNLTIHDFRERDYSGLTSLTGEADVVLAEQEAQRMVDEYEQEQDTTDLWNYVNNATKASLDKVYKSGLMSIDTYEHIRDMFDYYIPLQGWDETTSDEVYGYLNDRGAGIGSSPIKHAVGRKSLADDPIATIGLMADAAIRQGNRNLMKQNFYRFVLNHPSDLVSVKDLWLHYDAVADEWNPIFPDLDANDTAEEVERKIDEFEERMQQLAEDEPDNYKRGKDAENVPYKVVKGNIKEHQVLVRRGGRTYVLTINGNPRAAQALNGLTNPDVESSGVTGNILKAASWINHHLSAFYTTRNPDFVVSNFFRDMLYSNCMTWVKENPRYALRFHKNFGKFNPATMRRLFGKWQDGTLDMNDPTEYMFYQFMSNGGETGYTNVRDIEAHKKEIQKELKSQNSNTRKVMNILGMQMDLLNRAIENCARFAAFVTSREMGRPIDRSIYDAKEVSVNFNKKGSGGKMVNATGQTILGKVGSYLSGLGRTMFVFWNAGVQGLTNFGRAGKRYPAEAIAGAGAMFMLGYVMPVIAEALGGDDDDDKNAYYNLPEYVRRTNICIRFGKQWLTIPLPIEFRALYGLGELATGAILGKEGYSNNEMAYQFASQISQILPLDMLEGGGGISPFIPSTIKPYVESYIMNRSWSGLPIYKDTPFNKNEPEWTKAYSNTDKTLVSISKWLNENTGGDDFKKGKIDINPAKLEYLLSGTFGGYVSTAEKLKKMAETAIGERDFDWRNILLANRVVKNGDERTANRKLQNEYFKYLQEYNETSRLLRKYDKADEEGIAGMAEKIDFLYNSPEYLRYELFDEYKQDIDDCREELSEEVSPEERKKIQNEMYAIMRELVNQLREVK